MKRESSKRWRYGERRTEMCPRSVSCSCCIWDCDGEVTARVAQDIDDGGSVLWVPSGKTKNAEAPTKNS